MTHVKSISRAKRLVLRQPSKALKIRNARLRRQHHVASERVEPVRLQKALAQSGVGSRRRVEEWIACGQVRVNNQVATLGMKVGPNDRVELRGKNVRLKWADRLPRIILYHKPDGEIVSRHDPQGRATVFDQLPQTKSSRWVTVGRLDYHTSGLLILTTSGLLANRMTHPRYQVDREYAVRTLGTLTTEQISVLQKGIQLEDGPAKCERLIDQGGEGLNHWYHIIIREGRYREVRRMFEHIGVQVSRLIRVRFGSIAMPSRLRKGQFYELNESEVVQVLKSVGMLQR